MDCLDWIVYGSFAVLAFVGLVVFPILMPKDGLLPPRLRGKD